MTYIHIYKLYITSVNQISLYVVKKKDLIFNTEPYYLSLLFKSNEFLRNVFELGPPVMLDAATLKTMKISRFERVGLVLFSKELNSQKKSGAKALILPGDRYLAMSV